MAAESFHFASALSTPSNPSNLSAAIDEVCEQALEQFTAPPDLALLFASADLAENADQLAREVKARLGVAVLLGCTGESLVGVGREVEGQTALSLWLARMPGVSLLPMHLTFERTPEGGTFLGWPDELLDGWPKDATMLAMGDPFSFPADVLLERMNDEQPGLPIIGGMASGAATPGEARLFWNERTWEEGAVAVLLSGAVRVRSVVSQGCRPIGRHFVITKSERNVIFELGGQPALKQLEAIFKTLPTREQQLVNQGLHVGRVVSEYQDHFEQGDFLVRNVMGFDPDVGAIAIGDFVRPGQTVQFHIRDHQTAEEDLRRLLTAVQNDPSTDPRGALLFTCNGRGSRFFPEPHHDATAIQTALGKIPLAGFFAAGELGPVAGKNFLHGFTASIALLEPASSA